MAAPDVPGRLLVPELPAADLVVQLIREQPPAPCAPLEEFRAWSDALAAARARVRTLQAKYAPWLCRSCWGFTTIADRPCPMCEATGLSVWRRQTIRFQHNGK